MNRSSRPSGVVLRQLLLTLGAVTVSLLFNGATIALFHQSAWWGYILGTVSAVLAVMGAGMVWFIGEDSLDVEPEWIAPVTVAMVVMMLFSGLTVTSAYQELFGQRVVAVVTRDWSGVAVGGGDQHVKIAVGPGGELTSLTLYDERDLQVDDEVIVQVDPRGWFPMSTGLQDLRRSGLFHATGAISLGVMGVMTVLRTIRDLRRLKRAGSRLPSYRSAASGTPPIRGRAGPDGEPALSSGIDDRHESVDHSGDDGGGDGGD